MSYQRLLLILLSIICQTVSSDQVRICKWDVHNCGHAEVICGSEEMIHLDAKYLNQNDMSFNYPLFRNLTSAQCFAIKDDDKGDFGNYEIKVDIMSFESMRGVDCGNLGIIFNFRNEMNYDFIYLE